MAGIVCNFGFWLHVSYNVKRKDYEYGVLRLSLYISRNVTLAYASLSITTNISVNISY